MQGGGGGERSFSQWVKSLGAVWRLGGGWSTFVAYNEGFGVPDVGLVLRAVNTANQSVDKLISLEQVVTDNREVGLAWRGRQGSFAASVYDSRSKLGSQIRVDATTGVGSVLRVPVQVKGLEFSGELKPLADWTLSASYVPTRGKTATQPDAPLDVSLGARSQGPGKLVLAAAWQFASMSGGAVISYRKGLQPGQRYRLRFSLAGANEAWNFMRFEFLREDGTLCAAGYMKGAAVARTGLVPNRESYGRLGLSFEPGELPAAVQHWLSAERALVADAVV